MPDMIGFTTSRWLGLGTSSMDTVVSPTCRSFVKPRWYFTSPVLLYALASPCRPSNSPNISTYDIPITCTSTLMRPRCAIAITTSRAPPPALRAMVSSIIGTSTSLPSMEKRL